MNEPPPPAAQWRLTERLLVSRAAAHSFCLIVKPIAAMDPLQVLRMNIEAVQCKRRSLAHSRQSADMTARKLSPRNLGFHDVPGLKSLKHCLARAMCFWKAVLIGSAHLT